MFSLSGNGYYRFMKLVDNKWTDIIPWKQNPNINKYNGSTNTIRIEVRGKSILFYINEKYITATSYDGINEGLCGFGISNKQKIEVDYVFIEKL